MSSYTETHPTSGPTSGDLVVSRLVLTGWGQTLHTWSTDGVIFWNLASAVLSGYRRKNPAGGYTSTDRVCYGTVSSGLVTLAQDNSSGISGSATVAGTSGEAHSQIAFADETDVREIVANLASALSSSQWEGGARFEKASNATMRDLCEHIRGRLARKVARNAAGRIEITDLARPGQARGPHARLTAAYLIENLGGVNDTYLALAQEWRKQAGRDLDGREWEIDEDDDGTVDAVVAPRTSYIVRS